MQKFTIKDVENMCDIKAHTLRVWEQRYTFFSPKRKESKHRYYDNDDLKRLLRIAFLYHHGYKVSRIEAMSEEEILIAVKEIAEISVEHERFILMLIEAAIDFDEVIFNTVLDDLIRKFGVEITIAKICYPFLNRVGLLWMTNHVIPAQEHFASYLIQHKIIAETDKLTGIPITKPVILLYTPDGEFHELPLLFMNYLLKRAGWRTIYLGANIKVQHLKEVAQQEDITYIFTHIITNFTRFEIDDYLEQLCVSFPKKTIVASGANAQAAQRQFLNLRLLRNDEAIYRFIEKE